METKPSDAPAPRRSAKISQVEFHPHAGWGLAFVHQPQPLTLREFTS
jgi:hypothetical protein